MNRYELVMKNGVYYLYDVKDSLTEINRYNNIKSLLTDYYIFTNSQYHKEITILLERLKKDAYIDLITLFFKDGLTAEEIAENLGKDASTIKRNKKRLCLIMAKLLEVNSNDENN